MCSQGKGGGVHRLLKSLCFFHREDQGCGGGILSLCKGLAGVPLPSLHLPHTSQSTADWKALLPFPLAVTATGVHHGRSRVLTGVRGHTGVRSLPGGGEQEHAGAAPGHRHGVTGAT